MKVLWYRVGGAAMTMQISDTVLFDNEEYTLYDVENKSSIIKVAELGLYPKAISSACWRGNILSFSVTDKILLNRIIIRTVDEKYPAINNVVAQKLDDHFGAYVYNNVNLPFQYNGRMMIVQGKYDFYDDTLPLYFRRSRSVRTQYYSKVLELCFLDGMMTDVNDLSEKNDIFKDLIRKNSPLQTGRPSERERLSDDILITAFGKQEWWMHPELTADLKQAPSDCERIIK